MKNLSYDEIVALNDTAFYKKWKKFIDAEYREEFERDLQALWENGYMFHHIENCDKAGGAHEQEETEA